MSVEDIPVESVFDITLVNPKTEKENYKEVTQFESYFVEWVETGMKIQLNFTNSQEISNESYQDRVSLKIKDKLQFISKQNFLLVEDTAIQITFPIPSQLPTFISEEEIQKAGEQTQQTMMALFIVLLLLQLVLKTVIEKMMLMILTVQVI